MVFYHYQLRFVRSTLHNKFFILEFFEKKLFLTKSIFCLGSGLFSGSYCIFGVYLVTGTKNTDISEEGTFQSSIFTCICKM
jgi:hypothetical protein